MEKSFWRKRLSCLFPSPSSCAFPFFFFFSWFVRFAGIVFSRISSGSPCHLFAHADGSCRRHGQNGGTSPFAGSRSLGQWKTTLKPPTPDASLHAGEYPYGYVGCMYLWLCLHARDAPCISRRPHKCVQGHFCCIISCMGMNAMQMAWRFPMDSRVSPYLCLWDHLCFLCEMAVCHGTALPFPCPHGV